MTDYPDTLLFIDGTWQEGAAGRTLAVENPATGRRIGTVSVAEESDLERAMVSAERGFRLWSRTPARERAAVLTRAAALVRERVDVIAPIVTLEQGKLLAESRAEVLVAADVMDWFAGEAVRTYGRVVPARDLAVSQTVLREPVGPVVAFSPWNFPINQLVRKLSAAVATGCSVVAKAPEETPASPAALVTAFQDAGLPAGVMSLVYGDPAAISSYLLAHPVARKVTFTGSTTVGKQLAALAGTHMLRVSMELGGHAPVIVAGDADVDSAVRQLVAGKFRNAGQVCISPTRFLVDASIYDRFTSAFASAAEELTVGDGLLDGTTMGPLANPRRTRAMDQLVADALDQGAELLAGGERVGDVGELYRPTVLGHVPASARAMNEEPFGPLALMTPYTGLDAAIAEANRLPYGLASYAFTESSATAHRISQELEVGMLSINHLGLALPETPNGGVKDSGFGAEGGTEAVDSYLTTKLVSHRH